MHCDIIKDLLPLYAEAMVSTETENCVREHLQKCDKCKQYLNYLQQNETVFQPVEQNLKPLKSIQRKLLAGAVVLVVAVSLLWGLVLMQPGDEMAYSLLVFYGLLPLCGAVVSGILSAKTKTLRVLSPFLFAILNTVIPMIVFNGEPEWIMTAVALIASGIGTVIGLLVSYIRKKRKHKKG